MCDFISSRSSAAPSAKQNPHDGDIASTTPFSKHRKASLRRTLIKFLDTIEYPFTSYPQFDDLELAVRDEILSFGIDLRPSWEVILRTSCTIVGMAYIKLPIEIQFSVALLTWFAITMDDCSDKENPVALATFQQRYLRNQPQLEPFFDYFTAHLSKLWEYYHPIAANASVSALVDFASGCYLEIMTEGMKISPTAAHYPDYVRLKSGIADFYAFALWPAAQFPDIRAYVQAVPAISRFANIVNDILSFYKEELAGETVTYVHLLRAVRHKQSGLEIMHDLIDEAIGLSEEIGTLLSGEAKETWECFKTGYITYHLCDSRYKLSELCLMEGKDHASKE